ncbi:MAG: OmpH family outer membrane protein [Alphaproteobacteria bacterium]|nr:OmpH family outer membrane protein [Alphaproteobacteria bacterium]
MKKLYTLALAALFSLGLSVAPAMAQDAKPLNVAVVDIQALLKDSNGAKSIESQLETIRKNFQSEVEKEEKKLRETEKSILDQKDKLSQEDFKAKATDFQKQVADSQKKVQERKGKLDKALASAVGKLRTEIVKIVAEIGDAKKLDLVLARTDVVIVSKDMDITAQVMEKLNASLPSVQVTVE